MPAKPPLYLLIQVYIAYKQKPDPAEFTSILRTKVNKFIFSDIVKQASKDSSPFLSAMDTILITQSTPYASIHKAKRSSFHIQYTLQTSIIHPPYPTIPFRPIHTHSPTLTLPKPIHPHPETNPPPTSHLTSYLHKLQHPCTSLSPVPVPGQQTLHVQRLLAYVLAPHIPVFPAMLTRGKPSRKSTN